MQPSSQSPWDLPDRGAWLLERTALDSSEVAEFDALTSVFEVLQEHVVNPALMLHITR